MIVVPADFTSKQMSAASANPEASQIELYINQGSFGMLSTMIETAMKNMISQMSDAVKPQIATSLTSSGVNISEQQLAFYDEPIGVSVEHINPIDNMGSGMMSANGNALAALAMFLSMGAIYLPYNALPAFWQYWIYPWAPVRIIGQGLREIFFLDGGWFNSSTVIMIVLAVVGICLSYLSLVRKGNEEW